MRIDHQAIAAMHTRKRAAFINSLSGVKSSNLIGTADRSGHTDPLLMALVIGEPVVKALPG